ncbi:aldo/keto reductase [Oleiagrimonas sp. C23AA]|uniref:aldo/keto reductase n=1 Tax=Oleiagrimonas sp. C23AA TaxID=2719047 RepID=UPI00141DA1F9|nr:aldo/keto reductase [Oleiagrimonas sp. C23AA]NII10793.1 oxidoreductase [Oleiagrimonas sp. C23AA]
MSDATIRFSPIVAGLWRLADWQLDVAARVRWIEQVLELGITTFDHADIYGDYRCEALFGQALAAAPQLRQRMQLVTKCGIRLTGSEHPYRLNHYDTTAAYVRGQVEASLRKLHTEQLDVVLLHRPDYLMDAQALAETCRELTAEGKVAHWGVSNHRPSQLALLHDALPLVAHQVELSPLAMGALDDGTLDQCQQMRLAPMIWSPLAGGRLFTGEDAQALRVRAELESQAHAKGVSVSAVVYAWLLRHPSRPHPITGSGRIERLREAVEARHVAMPNEDWYAIWQASTGHPVP